MLKIIACDDDVVFLDRLHRMIDRWSSETGTAVDVALVTRGEDLLARHAASRADIILLDMIMPLVNGMDTARELRQALVGHGLEQIIEGADLVGLQCKLGR